MPDRLAIIVPVLNESQSLADRLRGLQPLRERGALVVVVDGGSQDDSLQIACALADQVLQAPRGRASQMNAGARAAVLQSIPDVCLLFLHADTALPAQADRLISEALAQGAAWGRFDVQLDSPRFMLRVVGALMNWRSRWSGIATGDQAVFVRRALFESVGGFPDIALMEDIALSRRLKAHSAPACLQARVLSSARRWEQHGVWPTIWLMWRLRAAYFFGADPAQLALRYGYPPRPDRTPDPASLPTVGVAVLARAPQAGQAKTRLIPALGAAAAARLQRRLTLQTLQTVREAQLGPTRLWCTPTVTQRFFRALQTSTGVACRSQPEGDIGERMHAAFTAFAAERPGPGSQPLLLIGTDCPAFTPAHLREAAQQLLAGMDAVLTPAEDGGYVLIGLQRPCAGVFEGIDWSTPQVMAQTRARLTALGLRWSELPTLWDVDRPEDLPRLAAAGVWRSGAADPGVFTA